MQTQQTYNLPLAYKQFFLCHIHNGNVPLCSINNRPLPYGHVQAERWSKIVDIEPYVRGKLLAW